MSVTLQVPYEEHVGNGITTIFPFGYLVLEATDLAVLVAGTLKMLNADYTVSGLGVNAGGSVTFAVPPAAGVHVVLERAMRAERLTDYQTQGDFLADVVNPDFDRAILLIQDLQSVVDLDFSRAISVPANETAAVTLLPPAAQRAGKVLSFNAVTGDVEVAQLVPSDATLSQSDIGALLYPRSPAEVLAGVTPTNYAFPEYHVGRYGALPGTGLDAYPGIQTALDVATFSGSTGRGASIALDAGIYMISQTLRVPNATAFDAKGRQQTIIRTLAGFTGVMMTDKGNASKIFLREMRMERLNYAGNAVIGGCTGCIKFGYGTSPFAQGAIEGMYLAAFIPGSQHTAGGGFRALDLVTNIASVTEVEVSNADYAFFEGPNSSGTNYTRCYSVDGGLRDWSVSGNANIRDCESEAPQATCVPIYVRTSASVSGLIVSQNNSIPTVNPYVIELADTVTSFHWDGSVTYNGSGTSTLTNVLKDNRTGYPLFWGDIGGPMRRVGLLADNLHVGKHMYLQDHKRQSFRLRLTNSTGIKHFIASIASQSVASSFADRIKGASVTLTTTPTGPDATTDFAAGAKIGSVNTNILWLNAGDQSTAAFGPRITLVYNTSGIALLVQPAAVSFNINGVTQNWFGIVFANATTGAGFNLTTLGAGLTLEVNVEGYIN